jgi:MYXO-CTERM domain-containing protein
VSAETGETTLADGDGYFEFTVLAGDRVLGAEAEGYITGAAECTVLENGEVTCCVHIVKEPEGGLPDDEGLDDMGSEVVVVVSCATGGEAGSLGLLLPLLGLAFVLRLRRK